MPPSTLQDVSHVIQLAVAPVFLLTALAAFLGVLSTRLGRIVDRARVLCDRVAAAKAPEAPPLQGELALLARRRHLVNLAITFGVAAALFVCVLIAIAFVGSIWRVNTSTSVALLFVAAMVAFVVALVLFLSEVLVAVASVTIQTRR
jgi:hypothetical protein